MAVSNPTISVAIATYEMSGLGRTFLRQCLESIYLQNFSELEVVVSDDSRDDQLELECQSWSGKIRINYSRNYGPRISPSSNFNRAVSRCTGSIVKILCQDDLLSAPDSLALTASALNEGHSWLVSAYAHIGENGERIGAHIPILHPRIERVNTIGSHSGLAFWKVADYERFDERIFWRMDCELYRRLFEKFGNPYILLEESVSVRQWRGQSTNRVIRVGDRICEWLYVARKYPRRLNLAQY
jgi:glycosyltransferase involved in cell wall biosynthesis